MSGFAARPDLPPLWCRNLFDRDDEQLVRRVVEADVAAAFEQLRDNATFVAQLHASVAENIRALSDVASGRLSLEGVDLAEPRRLASLQARLGVEQVSLQLSYRVGFLEIWRDWAGRIDASGRSIDERSEAHRALFELILAYQNAALAQVASQHARVETSLRRSRDHVRQLLIRDLVTGAADGEPVDSGLLGYDPAQAHVVVGAPDDALLGAALLRNVRAQCHVYDILSYHAGDGYTVWWLGQCKWSSRSLAALDRVLRASGQRVDISGVHCGVAGFRDAYEQVGKVRDVRERWSQTARLDLDEAADRPRVLHYSDVGIEALLLTDVAAAARFVVEELGALAGVDRMAAILRETLRIWLEARTHVATAAALGLHEHTVRNRIRRIEELLGGPVGSRHAELALALRLRRVVAPDPAGAGADAPGTGRTGEAPPTVAARAAAHTAPPISASTVRARRLASSA